MTILDENDATVERELLLCFYDLTRYAVWAQDWSPTRLLSLMDGYYQMTSMIVSKAGGELVKTVGDAGFVVFPAGNLDSKIDALRALKQESDQWLADQGVDSEAQVRVHLGKIAVGMVAGRPDVFGHAVNQAAMLRGGTFVITDAVYQALSADWQQGFTPALEPGRFVMEI